MTYTNGYGDIPELIEMIGKIIVEYNENPDAYGGTKPIYFMNNDQQLDFTADSTREILNNNIVVVASLSVRELHSSAAKNIKDVIQPFSLPKDLSRGIKDPILDENGNEIGFRWIKRMENLVTFYLFGSDYLSVQTDSYFFEQFLTQDVAPIVSNYCVERFIMLDWSTMTEKRLTADVPSIIRRAVNNGIDYIGINTYVVTNKITVEYGDQLKSISYNIITKT